MDRDSRFQPITAILAALSLGRLQVGIIRASPVTLRIFASRLVRESLIAALRQEGHEFTEERFFAWYAGLDTLSDVSGTILRPPKALCQAILTEFRHSPWRVLAEISDDLLKAFLAPTDFHRGDDHTEAHAIIAEAHALLETLGRADDALPFNPTHKLFVAAAASPRFSREERTLDLIDGRAVERENIANARWALDIVAGQYLAPGHGLPVALPLPGLVSLPIAQGSSIDEHGPSPSARAIGDETAHYALHEALSQLDRWLGEAETAARDLQAHLQDRRRSGRAHQLGSYLAGFGSMRGLQIERLLGVSRNGVAVITTALEASLLLSSQPSRNGARMYAYTPMSAAPMEELPLSAPSDEALRDYDDAMRAIDELLARSSGVRREN